jgi:hypothetical protein
MDEQHRCAVRVVVQDLQCLPIALDGRIANDVDRVCRATSWPGSTASSCASVDAPSSVNGTLTWAAASAAITPAPPPLVRMVSDSLRLVRKRASVSAARNSSCKLFTRSMPARAMAASYTASDPARGASVRGCRLLTLRRSAALDDDDGLVACRRARGGHKLARRLDRLDVEQDRARVRASVAR